MRRGEEQLCWTWLDVLRTKNSTTSNDLSIERKVMDLREEEKYYDFQQYTLADGAMQCKKTLKEIVKTKYQSFPFSNKGQLDPIIHGGASMGAYQIFLIAIHLPWMKFAFDGRSAICSHHATAYSINSLAFHNG